VWCRDRHIDLEHGGGPASLDVTGLAPATRHRLDVSWPGGRDQLVVTTLAPPAGTELCRIATVSDLHLGAQRWGLSKMMADHSDHPDPFPLRSARSAIREAVAWGAELLVVKGDAAHHQDIDHFQAVGDLLDEFPDLPVLLIPGNHDVDGRGWGDTPAKVGDRGVPYIRDATCVDLPGLRVIVTDSTVPGSGSGSMERVRHDVIGLAAVAPGPYLVGLHHQLQPYRWPTHYPIGVPAPGSTSFLDDLAAANPDGIVTSGHTHRNRARRHRSLMITEVAATRDWPGVWAGYVVTEGGIRQVVRRIAGPEAMTWHEYSRRALLGLWGRWAPGPLDQRCFTHHWPGRR
jgi:predicted phosphodiesterase